MPAFSITSLDRLIQPSSSPPSFPPSSPSPHPPSSPFSFYPPFYATPLHQRPPSPSPSSPSPYVLNFKRRSAPPPPPLNGDPLSTPPSASVAPCTTNSELSPNGERRQKSATNALETPAENEVFDMEMEKQDTPEGSSSGRTDLGALVGGLVSVEKPVHVACSPAPSLMTNEDLEFFDAPDSVFSDPPSEDETPMSTMFGRSASSRSLGSLTPRLHEEIKRRITAEENCALFRMRLNELAKQCSAVGLSISLEGLHLPDPEQSRGNISEGDSQEVIVARLVGGAIARGAVAAQKEEELENLLASKNREISRLWDKLQYLELVNREMFQRNQEITELTQRRRRRRRMRQKWATGIFCATFCIGTIGLVCYKFIPWEQVRTWAKPISEEAISDHFD